MKKLRIITLMTVLALLSADSFGGPNWFQKYRAEKHRKVVAEKTQPVDAPLDGGLLAILGAAGIAYYGARKKKRNSAE